MRKGKAILSIENGIHEFLAGLQQKHQVLMIFLR
jgi:hypothetical protein